MNNSIDIIRCETQQAARLLEGAADLMRTGRLVSIQALQNRIDAICRAVEKTGYHECLDLKPEITSLLKRLDDFSTEMKRTYNDIYSIESK